MTDDEYPHLAYPRLAMLRHRWMDGAECVTSVVDFFSNRAGEQKKAKAICEQCEKQERCLKYALDEGIEFGTWGGTTEQERLPMIRERRADG